MTKQKVFDVAVVGAGVFGAWTAYLLRLAGAEVILLDAYGAGNSRASSGGESRIIRMGYGPDEVYTRMAKRSLPRWLELSGHDVSSVTRQQPSLLFQRTGVLWLAREEDDYCEATINTLKRTSVPFERLTGGELSQRYSQLELRAGSWGILEPDSGVLMARRAVRAVVGKATAAGVTYQEEAIRPPEDTGEAQAQASGSRTVVDSQGSVEYLKTNRADRILARDFVFACGPWLPKLFPSVLGGLIHVTRQEVVFFGVPAGDNRFGHEQMPAWIDFNDLVYGIPSIDNRGFKVAIDRHGSDFDPDCHDRVVSASGLMAVRSYLAERMPALSEAPVTETRVCQYENTSSGDFLIDRHPGYENVWFVGGGSGHGFKHGPAVGESVVALLKERTQLESRFTLTTREKVQQRKVF